MTFETCKACENTKEHVRCVVCGMTGPEIYEARMAEAERLAPV